MMERTPTKLNELTYAQNTEVIKLTEQGAKQGELATQFKVHRSTICKILKNKIKVRELNDENHSTVATSRKRKRTRQAPDVEIALLAWFQNIMIMMGVF